MESYTKGIQLINIIKESRILINKANNEMAIIEDERGNIIKGSLMTEKYAKNYVEARDLLEESYQKYEESYNLLMSLKETIDPQKWIVILTKLGEVLGETENIMHMKDAVDEYTLDIAVKETMETYKYKKFELKHAYKNNDEDKKIILESEIKFLEKELQRHLLGSVSLNNYNNNLGR